MVKCPFCNSDNVKKYDWDIDIDGDDITLSREYCCRECKEYFRTNQVYSAMSEERVCEEDE